MRGSRRDDHCDRLGSRVLAVPHGPSVGYELLEGRLRPEVCQGVGAGGGAGPVEAPIPLIYALWDNTYAPVARYDFDDPASINVNTVPDQSGNGLNLTLSGNSDFVASFGSVPDTYCMSYDSGSQTCGSSNAAFRLAGDMTFGLIWMPLEPTVISGTTARWLVSQAVSGETLATNYLYALSIGTDGYLRSFWEHDAGVNVDVSFGFAPNPFEPTVYHYRRTISGGLATLDFFVNGYLMFTQGGLTPPNGGTSTTFRLGGINGSGGANDRCQASEFHQFVLYGSALTDAQIRELARAVCTQANETV